MEQQVKQDAQINQKQVEDSKCQTEVKMCELDTYDLNFPDLDIDIDENGGQQPNSKESQNKKQQQTTKQSKQKKQVQNKNEDDQSEEQKKQVLCTHPKQKVFKCRKITNKDQIDFSLKFDVGRRSIVLLFKKIVHGQITVEEFCKRVRVTPEFCKELLEGNNFNYLLLNQNKLWSMLCEYRGRYNYILKYIDFYNQVIQFEDKMLKQELITENYSSIQWAKMPKQLIPEMMSWTTYIAVKNKDWKGVVQRLNHGKRKRKQIDYLMFLIDRIIKEREKLGKKKVTHIVDFAGGKGDLSLVVAYFYPQIKVSIVDINQHSIIQAQYRKDMLNLKNVDCIVQDIQTYDVEFDIALGLHCCGFLSDIVLKKCFEQKVMPSICVCTCCFGKIKHWFHVFKYPRYYNFVTTDKYMEIAAMAENDCIVRYMPRTTVRELNDQDWQKSIIQALHKEFQFDDVIYKIAKDLPAFCRRFINSDRLLLLNQELAKKNVKEEVKIVEIPGFGSNRNQIIYSV